MTPHDPILLVSAAILRRGDEILLTRRPPGTHLEGLWEFPGGKIEPGESPEEAVRRELFEELGIAAGSLEPYAFVFHAYPERRVLLLTFLGDLGADPPAAAAEWRWRRIADLDGGQMPAADRLLIDRLQKEALT